MTDSATERTPAPESPPAPPRRRKRSLLKILVVLVVLTGLLVASLPYLLSTGFVRGHAARMLGTALGTQVTIGDHAIGWSGTLDVGQVTIANPPGFPADRQLLRMRSAHGGISLSQLVRGRINARGVIDGLELRIVQKADGTINVTSLGGQQVSVATEPGIGTREVDIASEVANVRLDFELRDSTVEIVHEEHGTLEQMTGMTARLAKEFGTSKLRIHFATDLTRPGAATSPGRIAMRAEVDADPDKPMQADIECVGLDLARYRPVVAMFVPPDQLTAFAGVVAGNLKLEGALSEQIVASGAFEVTAPHFAGPLLADMDIRAPRWTFTPNVTARLRDGAELPDVDVAGLAVDLGFLTAQGLASAAPTDGGARPIALQFDLDVAKLAEYGGSIPAQLRGSATRVVGTLSVPLRLDFATLSVEQMIASLKLDAQLSSGKLVVAEQVLEGLGGHASLQDGKLKFATGDGAKLSGGGLHFAFDTDLADLTAPPIGIEFRLGGAQASGNAVQGLQYFVPVLAGLASQANVDFQSGLDIQMRLAGPALRRDGQSILDWLNGWEGSGALAMRGGSFTPAEALTQVLTLTGQKTRLDFDDIDTKFELSKGFIQTGLMKLASRGRTFGLSGRTSLAGDIEYSIDVKDMLKDIPNSEQVLKYVGDRALSATLGGTLEAPRLQLPDLQTLLQEAAKSALQQQAADLLKGVIPGGKKKDGEDPLPLDPAEVLRRLIPGQKK